ncbi:c-type cytochrome [Novosphingobium jiangmenense]|uniref:Cytochrome c n=1 Tax=Novosphingobium jiangmenense TaxID=2791981 RepID=A0ABS0HLG8_9SPHN|nr:cytochrome c [Novosphingobium jiangmenense]MBF9153091.1 cytochrome c [Novosphingobium jiangmenense]
MKLRILPVAANVGAAILAALTLPASAAPEAPALRAPAGKWPTPQVLWEKTCARCHTTGVGPELRGRALPPEYVASVVRNGMMAMPAFPHTSIDDASLDGVARLVSTSKLPKPAAKR